MLRWTTRILAALALAAALATPVHAAPEHRPKMPTELPWVFIGDSLTVGFRVDPRYAYPAVFDRATHGVTAINLARSGSCLVTPGCYAWRPWVDEFDHIALDNGRTLPARVIVMLGSNDVCHSSTGAIEAGYQRLAGIAASRSTPITFLTIPPQAPPHAECEPTRLAVNDWLLHASGLDVVDVTTPLANEAGQLQPAYDTDDGLHINAAGQRVVADTIESWHNGL